MIHQNLRHSIDKASNVIGKTWPLYSFVTSNPLSGYESMPFDKAVNYAKHHLGSEVYPKASIFRKAWLNENIDSKVLANLLAENEMTETPEFYLNELESIETKLVKNVNHDLDRTMSKWLSAFLDEGLAEWQMPNKAQGFFNSWKILAPYDKDLGTVSKNEIPNSSKETLVKVLSQFSEHDYTSIFTYHLAALPGWVGYINFRTETQTEWHKNFPIDLVDYLAVRLWIAQKINATILPDNKELGIIQDSSKLQYVWLKAWERTWQQSMTERIEKTIQNTTTAFEKIPDAQLVFCIDTRSELIRRHVESKGNYETFGYAGFFGIATDYEDSQTGVIRKSCPPILPSSYKTTERPQTNKTNEVDVFRMKTERYKFTNYLLKRLKNMLPSAFGFVEGTGIVYGISMVIRTLIPGKLQKLEITENKTFEHICEPELHTISNSKVEDNSVSLDEKAAIVKTAFDLLGWTQFAPLVVFTGHGSHSSNNAFASSLDCGACAASPGRHNARMLAKLANDKNVRSLLQLKFNINIPEDTLFVGAEHNTTTDKIELFDSEAPETHKDQIEALKANLILAQESATKDRLRVSGNGVTVALKKAQSWSETRPEWGLAKNAGFVIGSRELTKDLNLDGNCFLHSYDWKLDEEGKALEGIMQGPMVVTQWINNHYYFSTVDNDILGGGSKITHNVTGKFGVVQGNGGDLKFGLPLQSVNATDTDIYHKPLRLSVIIHAPVQRVSTILLDNKNLKNLIDNEWIYLMVIDPSNSNSTFRYRKNMNWDAVRENTNRSVKIKKEQTKLVKEEVLIN